MQGSLAIKKSETRDPNGKTGKGCGQLMERKHERLAHT
jgi:hypothetical protein